MERLKQRAAVARKALETFKKLVGLKQPSLERRDAAIQRFEYTFEATWKAAQRYLIEQEGLDIASPKACMRASREVGFLSDAQTSLALKMADARNLTSHTYNERLAKRIYRDLARYGDLLETWLAAVEGKIRSSQ